MSGNRKCQAKGCKVRISSDLKVCEDHDLQASAQAWNETVQQAAQEIMTNHAPLLGRLARGEAQEKVLVKNQPYIPDGIYELGGAKHDSEKPDFSLLSSVALNKVAQVMTFGKRKYTAHNWRKGIAYSRLLAASLRHIFAYLGGESVDPESGVSHLAHAVCCLCMVLEFEDTQPHLDDRYKKS